MYIRRTKIISTIGPDSNTLELIEQLIAEGVDYFRLNCSHGTLEWHRNNILKIRQLALKTQKTIGIIIDLQGPKIRIGDIEGGWVELNRGDRFILTVDPVLGTKERISTSYLHLPFDVKAGDQLFIDDGFINVSVEGIDTHKKELECKVLEGGILKSRKGINLPQAHISTPSLTEDDMPYLQLALDEEVDYIALSFVRFGKDVVDLKRLISDQQKSTLVIAKIECREALDHIDEIIDAADAVLVARGDLGVEIPPESVPLVQKELIFQCNMKGKPVITATQMLESMIKSPRPTRAEISDVANAILDGTDAVMVSSETAIGKYPVEVIQFLRRVAQDIEQRHPDIYRDLHAKKLESIDDLGELITHTASIIARNLKAKAIVTYVSDKGLFTVLRKLRSVVPIIALTSQESVLKQVNLIWGVCAVKVDNALDWSHDAKLIQVLERVCDLRVGDRVLLLLSSKEDAHYFDALRVLEV